MLKYVNTGIVFQEIPDEVTLSVNLSRCPCHCPGCHSQYLAEDIGEELTESVLDRFVADYGSDITCIAFMGGDAEPTYVNRLAVYMHQQYPQFKVAWYSGRTVIAREVNRNDFDYIKIGPYIAHLGPLNSPRTNQHLYKRVGEDRFEDITSRFWKK